MMPTPGDIIVIQKMLVKLGQASVTVTRVGHSTDLKFSEKHPHCHVTVTATDPADKQIFPNRELRPFRKGTSRKPKYIHHSC